MRRSWVWIIGIVALVLTLSSIVTVLYGLGFRGKTLFEWMDILIVPITVGIGVYLLEQLQRRREQEEREREERRREEEREKSAALEEYFHQMSEALTEYGLSSAEPDNEVAKSVRAGTLLILGILDPVRKGRVVRFLFEAGLINSNRPIVVLAGADLDGAFLRNQPIREIDLAGTHLRGATLIAADLYGANLREADLTGADLSHANLSGAILDGADLGGAVLYTTNLSGANLNNAKLEMADLRGTNLSYVDLRYAHLSGADLSDGADLRGADLRGVDLGVVQDNLDQWQINRAIGDQTTTLLRHLYRPESWRKSLDEQRRLVDLIPPD